LTYDELKNLYQADKLNHRTKVFGLVGNPVKHSKGISFHNKIFSRRRLNAVYVNFLLNDLPKFLSTFRNIFTGLSITMPFKEEIVDLLDYVEIDASRLGVCNTIIKRNGKLVGFNTDLPAVVSLLKKRTNLRGKKVIVLGTGATSKTMAFATFSNNCKTTIIGRNPKRAEILAKELGCEWTTFENLSSLDANILMNGTSVGMTGTKKIRLVPLKFFRKGMIVFDAVSDPIMTTLLHDATETDCRIITGVEFFEHQAQLQSKLFIESIR
jgi:shikimate dehydrogenase